MHPLALLAIGAVVIVVLVLVLPTVTGFLAFLFSGDVWRALIGVALLTLIAGLAIAMLIGRFEPRRSGGLWTLVWVLIALTPICAAVALVGSGWLLDIVHAVEDLFSGSI